MTTLIDKRYYDELSRQEPADICRRAVCDYDHAKKSYTISAWGDEYEIHPAEYRIDRITQNGSPPHGYFFLFIVYYMVSAKEIPVSSEWISEKDMPGGATFFRGPHAIPVHLISNRYGNDIEAFKKRCGQLGGTPLDMGDGGYAFPILPRIPAAVVYWEGDEEFAPEAKLLYDRTITAHLTLDIIFTLAIEVCTRIGKSG